MPCQSCASWRTAGSIRRPPVHGAEPGATMDDVLVALEGAEAETGHR